ncbi:MULTISPECIES: sigma-70 family RNA polymerase sigma factor [unclassified Sphingobacterium]|uniref:sigma-70 family RNA polymerase sigma factor n=1 Tax=unclassified Sphingobacterium TaxID=2609468 RepID=UPI001049C98A|nr:MULTISPECIES: sigma-70 family RNA polymerase sigma factor [unclassified Sphingobacterium]MCS3554214.1 RNA polymerase sigma-70 factor (ECF subfamily) [Sphingobacterium sp. JUb21]TCR08047.1 RNA polymerase sigma-70 factor (ECF subfamily) [Sphingobacterium sp. JUb20]
MESTFNNFNDDEIFVLVKQNNEKAFEFLYNKYWKKMLYKAQIKLQSEIDAEEVVQDVFVDLWNSRERITINYSFQTYIAAVTRYKIMAKMVLNKKKPIGNLDQANEFQLLDDSTQQWLDFSYLQAQIEMSIKELPEKCQLVFRMSRESCLTNKQIAIDLGISQKSVEAHISRALKSLKTSIGRFLFSFFF